MTANPEDFDRLVRGAIDIHVHGQPDLTESLKNRGDDVEVARMAQDYGMAGWVLKSHLWSTMDRARRIRDELGFPVHGRISPAFREYAERTAIRLCDDNGALTGRARAVIDACHGLGLALATGHASVDESRAVAAYCAGIGQRLLVTHPLHYTTDLREFTDMGAFVEFAAAPLLHPDGHLTIRDVHAALSEIGPGRVILSTDVFSRWVPPEPECLRMFLEQLAYLGWSAEDIATMVSTNPREFLGEPA
jgi:hypothetical protein